LGRLAFDGVVRQLTNQVDQPGPERGEITNRHPGAPGLLAAPRLRIPTMPSGDTEREASTCSDLMPSTVLR
jgi:hypothetical protein